MALEYGTDWSNYQPVPTPEDCAALLAAGFTFAIVGSQQIAKGLHQVKALRDGGITVEDSYVENGRAVINDGIWRCWIAVETGSNFTTEMDIAIKLSELQSMGFESVGIYTSPYMIKQFGLDYLFEPGGRFADLPLWVASYGSPHMFEGSFMTQYSGNGRITGIAYELDLNVREALVPENDGRDIRDGQDVGLNRIDNEAAGRALRGAIKALEDARAILIESHKRNGGDGDLIRGL